MLLTAVGARAQELDATALPDTRPPAADQLIYKGLVGNLLETLPLDPDKRVELQRANAVVSSPLSGRSLALLLGISSPIFIIGGLIWGLWAATNIKAPAPDASWLAPPSRRSYGLGFCTRSRIDTCQFHMPDMRAVRVSPPNDTGVLAAIAQADNGPLAPEVTSR